MEKDESKQEAKDASAGSDELAIQPSHDGELISFEGLDPALAAKVRLVNDVR